MSQPIDALIADLIAWLEKSPRPYGEVMDAWRTSCPRLTVWEDAVDRGFVTASAGPGSCVMVAATPAGREFLRGVRREISGIGMAIG